MTSNIRKGRISSAIDLGVSVLAAVSAGFVFFAMPEGLFSALVVKSGLPNVLAAAEPPLGQTARLVVVAAAALFLFAFTWFLLRGLDAVPARTASQEADEEPQPEVLRLRKADAHPDAPARRPLLAGRDLGEPFEAETEAASPEPEYEPTPLPAFLVPQEPEPVVTSDPDPTAEFEPQPVAESEPEVVAKPECEPLELDSPAPDESADLSKLMERFESGLSRKQQAIVRAAAEAEASGDPAAPEASEEPSDRVGHRLRNAIAGLQKVSGGAG